MTGLQGSLVAALILAAGASSRMGRSKLLLAWRGTTLIRWMAQEALASRASNVFVVVGADAEAGRRALAGLDVDVVEHPGWAAGLGSSLAAGVRRVAAASPGFDAVVVLLADQPLVCSSTVDRLIDARETTGRPLVAALHGSDLGVPALFASEYFERLQASTGDHGAREILRAHAAVAATVDLPEARIDVDTPADYEALPKER